ncbi:hypothetical protein COW94_02865 [Candidatus Peregrinibacteria bacterium CG22_combo_CG10-13_8_21_14_all_44_10]|nr:MAG: hypothetical protein AUK45_00430 [Candidatus Peregrinibacteria bacterium CG2_30_44_17]PIP66218.1 MAG: hypothetical protein COW94_02865 [Candidatus Peregrinibacteria bacterium CG22_combo_CG10-13_8_21_14_all_44_10]PIS04480.1 MAG: hypothetical protein COT83_00275 [Candidatus Peregrinibacteria bacterium CG10_big_fil_rev_8_21_14_0_10_44_7]PIX79641.1 MAG: hypothetical protein COZ35_03105 [Candidatus Peregrinibacteria bacterium CG_4_10_14_3_um_filter_44_21]PJB88279.1 MAG: hypothetical protein 
MSKDKCCSGKLGGVFVFLVGLIAGAVIVGVLAMSGQLGSLQGKIFGSADIKKDAAKTTNLYIGVDEEGAWVQTLDSSEEGEGAWVQTLETSEDAQWVEKGDSFYLEEGEGAWVQTLEGTTEADGAWVQTLSPEANDAWVQTLQQY